MQKIFFIIGLPLILLFLNSCKKSDSPISPSILLPADTAKQITISPYPMPVGDLAGWKQVTAEDFLTNTTPAQFGASYANSWSPYDNGGKYFQSALSAANGMMEIGLDGKTGAAGVFGPKDSRWGHLYGRYSICFKAVAAEGNGTAIMVWPSSDVWGDGEIDYPEGNFDANMEVFQHGVGCTDCSAADGFNTGVSFRNWHIATTEWTPSSVKYYLDDNLIKTVTHDIPIKNHRFTIQMAPNAVVSKPGNFYIDWVTVYYPVP